MGKPFFIVDEDIFDSTVWRLPAPYVKVWITLMGMADYDSNVWATLEAVARRALVKPSIVKRAIDAFLAPDPESRCAEHGGRRLLPLSRGWHLVTGPARAEGRKTRRANSRKFPQKPEMEFAGICRGSKDAKTNEISPSDIEEKEKIQIRAKRDEAESGKESPRKESEEIENPPPPSVSTPAATTATTAPGEFGEFDLEKSWAATREMWESAGRWSEETGFNAARKAFVKYIDADNWNAFAHAVNWATRESISRGERNWLGLLYTFIAEERWKAQQPPINDVTPAARAHIAARNPYADCVVLAEVLPPKEI